MSNFFWRCLRESKFTELLLSSISYTLSSKGYLAERALFAKLSLLLLIVLASEKAFFSPLVSCSLLVEQIHESKRPEVVLQQEDSQEQPPRPRKLRFTLYLSQSPFWRNRICYQGYIFFCSLSHLQKRSTDFFIYNIFFYIKNASNSILCYHSHFTMLNNSIQLWHSKTLDSPIFNILNS